MPYRKQLFANNYYYHVYNKCSISKELHHKIEDLERFCSLLNYYKYKQILSYSKFISLPKELQSSQLNSEENYVDILAFSLMKSHYHLLLKQVRTKGVSAFISNIQLAYSKYINTKYSYSGPLFANRFSVVLIESEEQLIHVSRYIHLNPVSSKIITIENLDTYPYTSFPYYMKSKKDNALISTEEIIGYFGSVNEYRKFVFDNASYQKSLQQIKSNLLSPA